MCDLCAVCRVIRNNSVGLYFKSAEHTFHWGWEIIYEGDKDINKSMALMGCLFTKFHALNFYVDTCEGSAGNIMCYMSADDEYSFGLMRDVSEYASYLSKLGTLREERERLIKENLACTN